MDEENEAYLHRGSLYNSSAVYASCIATTLAALFWLLRLGISDNSPFIPLKVVTLSYFLLFFPGAIHHLVQQGATKWGRSVFGSYPALLVQGLLLLIVAGGLAYRLSMDLMPVFIVAGLALFLLGWRRFFLTAGLKRMLISAFFAFLFALWVSRMAWANAYQHPLYLELLAGGVAHIDTLFHPSVAGMIGTYGVPSTGLDGVPWVQNHFGSHWIFAHISKLLQMNPLQFYNVGYQVVFLPFLFHSMILLVIELQPLFGSGRAPRPLGSDPLFWLIFFAMTVGFLPPATNTSASLWNDILVSESYCVAMTLAFIVTAWLLNLVPVTPLESEQPAHQFWFLAGVLPVMTGMITLTKGSVGVLFLAVLGYLFLRLRLYRRGIFVLSGMISLCCFAIVFQWINPPGAMRMAPFAFLGTYVIGEAGLLPNVTSPTIKVATFFVLHYLGLWIFLLWRAWGPEVAGRLAAIAGRSVRKLDVEILVLVAVLGFLPGAMVAIPGASAVYFSDVQRWFSLVLLLALYPAACNGAGQAGMVMQSTVGAKLRKSIILCVAILVLSNLLAAYRAVASTHLEKRHRIVFGATAQQMKEQSTKHLKNAMVQADYREIVSWLSGQAVLLWEGPALAMSRDARYQMLKQLEHINELPAAEKRKALLYVPRSNRIYWEMLPCKQVPFLGPALGSIAMAGGLPPATCNRDYYGFQAYAEVGRPDVFPDLNAKEVLSYAQKMGFSTVIVMDRTGGMEILR